MQPPSPAEMSQHVFRRFQKDLALRTEESAQIKPLVDQMSSELDTIRSDTSKQISDRINETNAKIAEFLTPEQRAKLEKLEAERRKRFHEGLPLLPPR